jgi:predicted DNA-binding protein (MmcQ/YjbR family)
MNVRQLKQFCRGFNGATETLYEEPYNFLVYAVGGRKFAYFKTSHPERWRFSTRVAPDRFIELTDVPGVKPARYRGLSLDHDRQCVQFSCLVPYGAG